MRLNRYLAASGLGSRRSCEEIILAGKVSINGTYIRSLATEVAEGDVVRVSGRIVAPPKSATVIALYKPRGFVTTRADERGRKTVYDLLPPSFGRFIYIGRLDKDSEGLILLTDDGGLSQKLTHPLQKVPKLYDVLLDGELDPALIPKLLKGVVLEEGRARMEDVRIVGPGRVRVVLTQGLKRQIRQMFYRFGLEVKRLTRIGIGGFRLGGLEPGQWKVLNSRDIAKLTGTQLETRRTTRSRAL